MNTSPATMLVMESRTILMQRMLDYVRSGYDRFTGGSIATEKLSRFVRKMDLTYQVCIDKHQRVRRKRAGLGNAVLLMYRSAETDEVMWWLLVTGGTHPAHTGEKLQDVAAMKVFGHQMTHETRKGKSKPAMTWRMTAETYQNWRDNIMACVRSRSVPQMVSVLAALYKLPGFSGIRTRIGRLAVLYRAEVRRHGLENVAPPTPKRLGYVRRVKTTGVTVSQLARQRTR